MNKSNISRFYRLVSSIGRASVRIAEVLLFSIMILIAADVILRYVFNSPIPGSYELVEKITGLVVALSLAFCALEKGHVNVDIVVNRLQPKTSRILNMVMGSISFILIVLTTRMTALQVNAVMTSKLQTPVLYLPIYPFAIIVTIGLAFFSLVLLADIVKLVVKVDKV